MITHDLTRYGWEELPAPIQQKALEALRFINLCPGWWQSIFQDFQRMAAHFGLTVDSDSLHFSSFYQQESGCSYTAEIDVPRLAYCLVHQLWPPLVDNNGFLLSDVTTDPVIMDQLLMGTIQGKGHVRPFENNTRIYVAMEFRYPAGQPADGRHWDHEIQGFIESSVECCAELNCLLFTQLQAEYEHLISDERIRQTILQNHYQFTETGQWISIRPD